PRAHLLPPLQEQGGYLRGRDGAPRLEAGRHPARRARRLPLAARMNFQRGQEKEPLEINLVPLIDVMMVILIFLMITTTYNKYTELQINLPSADADKQLERSNEIAVLVNAQGQYVIHRGPLAWALWPASVLFRLAVTARRILYKLRLAPSSHPGIPVIVVGNLVAGGSGKTPLVIWIAEHLKRKGWSPAIVSRGYGARI